MLRKMLVAFFCIISLHLFSEDLQITSDEGFAVYVDGVNRGITTEFLNGLIISDLSIGEHIVILKKKGFNDAIYTIKIEKNKTFDLQVNYKESGKVTSLTDKDNVTIIKSTGNIVIKSLPLYADVVLNNKTIGKTDLLVEKMDEGPIRLEFAYKGVKLTYNGVLKANDTLTVKADFSKMKCEATSIIELEEKTKTKVIVNVVDSIFDAVYDNSYEVYTFHLADMNGKDYSRIDAMNNAPHSSFSQDSQIGVYYTKSRTKRKNSFKIEYEGKYQNGIITLVNSYNSIKGEGTDNLFGRENGSWKYIVINDKLRLNFSVTLSGFLGNRDVAKNRLNSFVVDNYYIDMPIIIGKSNTLQIDIINNNISNKIVNE